MCQGPVSRAWASAGRQALQLPMPGKYSCTCLSRKSQVVEKRRRDQRGDPPGKGTEGREGKRDKGKGLGLRSSRTQWG